MRRSSDSNTAGIAVTEKQLELDGMPPKPAKPKFPMLETFNRVKFIPAPEVEQVALEIIPVHHLPRWKASGVTPEIQYFFSATAPKIGGQDKTAICRKVGGFSAYLRELERIQHENLDCDEYNRAAWLESFKDPEDYCLLSDRHLLKERPFFCIIVHWHQWQNLDSDKRRALVDHELLHVGVEPGEKGPRYEVRPHTIEEFHELVRREGAWHEGLRLFADMMEKGDVDRKAAEKNLPEGMTVTFKYGENTFTLGRPQAEGKLGEILPPLQDSPSEPAAQPIEAELETCPLRVSARLFGTIMDGDVDQVFRHTGDHYVVIRRDNPNNVAEALRVQAEDVWRKNNGGAKSAVWDGLAADKRGMCYLDSENEPWVIVSNTRYQVVDVSAALSEPVLEAVA